MVVLRDGRKLIGTLRSFDQFGKNKRELLILRLLRSFIDILTHSLLY
jgi:hypothetical protein